MRKVVKAAWHIVPMVSIYFLWVADSYALMACIAVLLLGLSELLNLSNNELIEAQRDYIETLEGLRKKQAEPIPGEFITKEAE